MEPKDSPRSWEPRDWKGLVQDIRQYKKTSWKSEVWPNRTGKTRHLGSTWWVIAPRLCKEEVEKKPPILQTKTKQTSLVQLMNLWKTSTVVIVFVNFVLILSVFVWSDLQLRQMNSVGKKTRKLDSPLAYALCFSFDFVIFIPCVCFCSPH